MLMHINRLRSLVVCALVALAPLFSRSVLASTDYTDIWYNPTESGWGVNFAQTADFVFATFFIYGPSGTPVWYTAHLRNESNDVFTGPVYVTTGTWFGAPVFPPVPPSGAAVVGDATFTASSDVQGTFRYRIDTVNVTKSIQRQTTVSFSVDDFYMGGISGTVTGNCPSSTPSTFTNKMQFNVFQTSSNNVRIEFLGADSTNVGQLLCTIQGNAIQFGKVLVAPTATYQCKAGLNVTTRIESMRQLDGGIEAHWRADLGGGCIERGRLAGVRQE
jgi:hypothetical protein